MLKEGILATELLKRPEIHYNDIINLLNLEVDKEIIEAVEIYVKYYGYIKKANEQAEKMLDGENIEIPDNMNYDSVKNLASEAKEKLKKIKPHTIGQATRISGVNPADITNILLYLKEI